MAAATVHYVDCGSGSDAAGTGTRARPFRSPHQAQAAIRRARAAFTAQEVAPATVKVTGLCELPSPLALEAADSNVKWVGEGDGAILSGGTRIEAPASTSQAAPTAVDLRAFNFTTASLGLLKGRGYAGGSACTLLNNYESSPAELFYRPPGAHRIISDCHAPSERRAEKNRTYGLWVSEFYF